MVVRQLQFRDADDICAIYGSIVRGPVDVALANLIRAHADNPDNRCLVAESDRRVVGFMISILLTLSFGLAKTAWIVTFGVHPDFMGRGVGERLFREIAADYQRMGIRRIYTTVPWDACDVLSFFRRMGFDSSDFVHLNRQPQADR